MRDGDRVGPSRRASPDVLQAMIRTFAQALMPAEADAIWGAGYGQRSDERVNFRNAPVSRPGSSFSLTAVDPFRDPRRPMGYRRRVIPVEAVAAAYAQWITPALPLYGNDHERADFAP